MGKRKPQRGRPAGASPSAQRRASKPGSKQARHWGKPLAWSGGVATVVLAGVLVNVLSPQASRVISAPPAAGGNIKGTETPSTPASVSRPAAGTQPSADPLTVVSEDPIDTNPDLVNWVLPKPLVLSPAKLDSLSSSPNALQDYLFTLGAYEYYQAQTQLVVQNNQDVPLRVIDIGVIKSCTAPLDGTFVYGPSGAADPAVKMNFDLDSAFPIAETPGSSGSGSSGTPYFANYTVSIDPGAQQVFDLAAKTSNLACTFRYHFTILEGETKVYQIIGDGPGPFRVSGGSGFSAFKVMYTTNYCNPYEGTQWVKVDPKKYGSC